MNEKYNTPGKWLQTAREALKLQPDDIAKQMHLSVQSIIDLEQDDYAKIGVRTFARGYLSTYARIVNVSQPQILEMFDAMAAMPETIASGASVIEGAPVMNVTREQTGMRYSPKILMGAGGFFVVLFALIFHSGSKQPADVKKEDPTKPVAMMSESIAIPTVISGSSQQPATPAVVQPVEAPKVAPKANISVSNNVGSNTPFVKKPKERAHVTYKVTPVAPEEQKAS